VSDAIVALGRALHYTGVNVPTPQLDAAMQHLNEHGYTITRMSTPRFHVQPAPADGQVTNEVRSSIESRQRSTKGGSGRV